MTFVALMDFLGEGWTAALGGLVIGLLFGVFAQRSKFCLRSAVVEFARGRIGGKVSIWLLTFSAAVALTQALHFTGLMDISQVRQLSNTGSLSGAILGGLMFGAGMVLARGCSSRLLVLSANGNLRALLSGLIFAVTAQASLHGALSPLRSTLAGLWTLPDPDKLNVISLLSLPPVTGLLAGLAFLAGAIYFAARNKLPATVWAAALGAGCVVALGWLFTWSMAEQAFDIVAVKSLTFTGPSADTLMLVLNPPGVPIPAFNVGLMLGVFAGSFLAALYARELKVIGFTGGLCMRRYIFGAVLMGFGGMLAGGCAVGAGITGGSVFALVGWLALTGMWAGAAITDWLVDRAGETCPVAGPSVPVSP